jgi:hypothetical protein
MSAQVDHLTYNRMHVSSALRRLADAATEGAHLYAEADCVSDEDAVIRRVLGRVDGVRHAVVLVDATRRGIRNASVRRSAS